MFYFHFTFALSCIGNKPSQDFKLAVARGQEFPFLNQSFYLEWIDFLHNVLHKLPNLATTHAFSALRKSTDNLEIPANVYSNWSLAVSIDIPGDSTGPRCPYLLSRCDGPPSSPPTHPTSTKMALWRERLSSLKCDDTAKRSVRVWQHCHSACHQDVMRPWCLPCYYFHLRHIKLQKESRSAQ